MPVNPTVAPPIALEPGKYYRLRDNKTKLYVYNRVPRNTSMFLCDINGSTVVYGEGGRKDGGTKLADAVTEWRELQVVQLTGYQNIYSDHTFSEVFATKSIADEKVDSSKTRIACIDVAREVIEGQGLYD